MSSGSPEDTPQVLADHRSALSELLQDWARQQDELLAGFLMGEQITMAAPGKVLLEEKLLAAAAPGPDDDLEPLSLVAEPARRRSGVLPVRRNVAENARLAANRAARAYREASSHGADVCPQDSITSENSIRTISKTESVNGLAASQDFDRLGTPEVEQNEPSQSCCQGFSRLGTPEVEQSEPSQASAEPREKLTAPERTWEEGDCVQNEAASPKTSHGRRSSTLEYRRPSITSSTMAELMRGASLGASVTASGLMTADGPGQIEAEESKRPSLSDQYEQYDSSRKAQATDADLSRFADPVKAAQAATLLVVNKDTAVKKFVRSGAFGAVSAVLILSNALLMGCQLEYAAYDRVAPQDLKGFHAALSVFSLWFLIELMLRIYGDGPARFFSVAWNGVDAVITLVLALDVLFDVLRVSFADGAAVFNNASMVRLIQAIRILRLSRSFRMLRVCKPLRVFVSSIFNTLRSLAWAVTLLALITYTFAITLTQGTLDEVHGTCITSPEGIRDLCKLFGSVPRSAFTLFKCICNGLDWTVALEPLLQLHWLYCALFVLYVAFVYFAVLNVVTGVFVQDSIESAARDKDEVVAEQLSAKGFYVNKLRQCFGQMDIFQDGKVSFAEFERQMRDDVSAPLKACMALLDIDATNAWQVFKLLDTGGSLSINLDEFVEGCLRLQGDAKCIDVAKMQHEMRWMINQIFDDVEVLMGRRELKTSASASASAKTDGKALPALLGSPLSSNCTSMPASSGIAGAMTRL